MKSINVIWVFCVTVCLIINVLVKASENGITTAASRLNLSFEEEPYRPLFSSDGYPKPGDIPMLNRKVFRGMRVSIIEHPYIVSIRRKYAHYLTGTLLNRNVIATVAHPVFQVPLIELNIVVGENYADRGANALTVILLIIHENFDPYTLVSDIALMRIYETISYYKVSVKPVAGLFEKRFSYMNKLAFVTGWGRCDMTGRELCLPRSSIYFRDEKLDPMLRTITFEIKADQLTYCEGYKRHETLVTEGMLCMGVARENNPVSPCLAVPGAPLIINGKLLGIQSWGFGCGYNHDLPLVYTDVPYYHNWIINNIKILKRIKSANMSPLFDATKARKMHTWLLDTRKFVASEHDHRDLELQPIGDLDQLLANIKGKVYDLRDFVNHGRYHKLKTDMYQLIRNKNDRTNKLERIVLLSKTANLNKQKQSVPFIRPEVILSQLSKASHDVNSNSDLSDDKDDYETFYSAKHPSNLDDSY